MFEEKASSPSGKMGGEEKPVSRPGGTQRPAWDSRGCRRSLAAGAGVRKQEAAGTAWVGGVGDGGTHGKSEPPLGTVHS